MLSARLILAPRFDKPPSKNSTRANSHDTSPSRRVTFAAHERLLRQTRGEGVGCTSLFQELGRIGQRAEETEGADQEHCHLATSDHVLWTVPPSATASVTPRDASSQIHGANG